MIKLVVALIAGASLFFVYQLATRPAPPKAPSAGQEAKAPEPPPLPAANPPLIETLQNTLPGKDSTERLGEILKAGADPNALDKTGRSALSWATRNNDAAAIVQLVKAGADPNKRDQAMQWTPLMDAAYMAAREPRYLESMKALLAAGADVKAEKEGATAIHVAVNNTPAGAKSAPAIELLLQHGADPNFGSPAPLILAAWTGKLAAAAALVKGGASLAAPAPGAKTPAQTARDNKHPQLASFLEKAAKGAATKGAPKKKEAAPKRRPPAGKKKR